jgi:hypothetical protein
MGFVNLIARDDPAGVSRRDLRPEPTRPRLLLDEIKYAWMRGEEFARA